MWSQLSVWNGSAPKEEMRVRAFGVIWQHCLYSVARHIPVSPLVPQSVFYYAHYTMSQRVG